jgi:predicted alpha/beta hydrolase
VPHALEHSFEGIGGPQPAWAVTPDGPAKASFALMPALGIPAGYYHEFLERIADHGIAAAVCELPGSGESPARRPESRVHWSYDELVRVQAEGLFRWCAELVPGAPFFWGGHSLGGQVAALHTGYRNECVRGLALLASGSPHHAAWGGFAGLQIRVAGMVAESLALTLGYLPGDRLGFGGRESKRLISDWHRALRTGSFSTERFDGDGLLGAATCDALVVTVWDDDWAPAESARALLGRTRCGQTQWYRVEGDAPVGHNRWPRRRPREVAARLAEFVEQRLDRPST